MASKKAYIISENEWQAKLGYTSGVKITPLWPQAEETDNEEGRLERLRLQSEARQSNLIDCDISGHKPKVSNE